MLEWSETYVRAALALLISSDPQLELLRIIMPQASTVEVQIKRNKLIYQYLEDAILCRHLEDNCYAEINTR